MFRYILSTNDISSHGTIVETAGIDLSEFEENPVMLYNHKIDKVLGKWNQVIKEDNKLYGIAEFDNTNEKAIEIQNQVTKDYVVGVSIGAEILDGYIREEDDVLIITKSLLKEASITALPANKKARVIKDTDYIIDDDFYLQLSYDNETNINKIKSKMKKEKEIKNTVFHNDPKTQKMKDIKKDITPPEVEDIKVEVKPPVEDVKVEKKEKKKTKSTKKKVELSEDIQTLPDRIVKMLSIELSEGEILPTKILLSIGNLLSEHKVLKETIELKDETINKLKNDMANKDIESFIDSAIEDGKIEEESKDNYIKLANSNFETVKDIINNMEMTVNPEIKLTDEIKTEDKKQNAKKYLDYDPKELKEMSESNKVKYDKLFNEQYPKMAKHNK